MRSAAGPAILNLGVAVRAALFTELPRLRAFRVDGGTNGRAGSCSWTCRSSACEPRAWA